VDTNSRLCMASSVAAHRRAFGSDTVPGNYQDLDQADLILLVGSNAAWCHPVLFQRMIEARERRGTRIVVVDPRRTATAGEADLFLQIAPGMDTVLFCGLLADLADKDALDRSFIATHTEGFETAVARARSIAPSLERVAEQTGIAKADIIRFYELFRTTERSVSCFSQGVNQSAQGTDKANAIINCHLATGRIGRPGMGPFSLTGQPNAMGGREVGGLANQLAAHMNFTSGDIDRVSRFWNAPSVAKSEGLKAVQLFEAVERGEIKALWIMATNPAVSLPRASAVAEALGKLELLVVSENVLLNDTVQNGAHVLLPAAAWGEKDGTVTNSERRISRQRAFLFPPGEAKPDWKIVSEVAARMGFASAFAYASSADVFREHAALSGFENNGTRDFDIGGLARLTNDAFEAMEPVLWPVRARQEAPQPRFFSAGGFFTPSGRAKFVPPADPKLSEPLSSAFPLRLNTGRIRDQWHTMTRSGLSPRLGQHLPEPFVEIHPDDAAAYRIEDGGFARVKSAYGEARYKVKIESGQRRGSLFAPIHWSLTTSSDSRVGDVVTPATDPYSGQPEAKATAVLIEPVALPLAGFAISDAPIHLPRDVWWSRVTLESGQGVLFAGDRDISFWREFATQSRTPESEIVEYEDAGSTTYRAAIVRDETLVFCLFVGPSEKSVPWDSVKAAFARKPFDARDRATVLSGKRAAGMPAEGPIICSCFGIGLVAIRDALESGAACSVDEIGAMLRAGTNCGSCKPELRRIVSDVRVSESV
jgi:assimilatory nitrate reductase catalytic subunit